MSLLSTKDEKMIDQGISSKKCPPNFEITVFFGQSDKTKNQNKSITQSDWLKKVANSNLLGNSWVLFPALPFYHFLLEFNFVSDMIGINRMF